MLAARGISKHIAYRGGITHLSSASRHARIAGVTWPAKNNHQAVNIGSA